MKGKVFKSELSDEAEIDFDSSYEYFYDENPKVAETFFQRINISLKNIQRAPLSFPVVHKTLTHIAAIHP